MEYEMYDVESNRVDYEIDDVDGNCVVCRLLDL